jgi:hypothetical protein
MVGRFRAAVYESEDLVAGMYQGEQRIRGLPQRADARTKDDCMVVQKMAEFIS